ncbi:MULTISPECIES: NAD(P)H-dependent oxidoreductase [Citrobacter]|uniref:NAD(P)H-dependent oxidoreductase n=1 Tax=Citrobacter TaxID=544 RepID=UPI000E3C40AF|nr:MULTISPECIES: NAD(P)H-dependent oxidoreductase [Citrobacter]MBD0830239.1 NAD(P)H-dependent oxidoreductase [Citrobacter sp. C1]RFU89092.1 flavodoxin family protein [Citrobacter gillenii]
MQNVLIINTHQRYEGISTGKLNRAVVELLKQEMEQRGSEVQLTEIEQGYDINEEVQKHLWADVIITQSPVFWFGAPWIYKKYIDEVFTAGMLQGSFLTGDGRTREDPSKQYGTGGKLQGKKHMLSLTWNAPKAAFDDSNQIFLAGKSVDDALLCYTASYKFCGVEVLPTFSCFDVFKNPEIGNDFSRLKQQLATAFD